VNPFSKKSDKGPAHASRPAMLCTPPPPNTTARDSPIFAMRHPFSIDFPGNYIQCSRARAGAENSVCAYLDFSAVRIFGMAFVFDGTPIH